MNWFLYALLCALAEALKDITSKKGLRSLDPLSVSWAFFFISTLLCAPLLLLEEIPTLGPGYWWCLFSHGILYGASVYLYMKAISLSELSVTVPLIMFTPIFMLITAPIALGEWPSMLGVFGTLLIVVGSYLLNVSSISKGLFAPFQALLAEPGARLMLFVAFIWSITSVIDKIGIQQSAPIFWGVTLYAFITCYMSVIVLKKSRNSFGEMKEHWRFLIPIGVFNAVQVITYVFALQSGLAVYVLAIKRISVLLVVLLGALLFGEYKLRERLFAVVIMLLGVFCISMG